MIKVGISITKNKLKYQKLVDYLCSLVDIKNKIQYVFLPTTQDIIKHINNLDVLLTYKIHKEYFNSNHDIKWIQLGNAGVDDSMIASVIKSKTIVTNSRGINSIAVAEYVMSVLLYLSKQISMSLDFQKSKQWTQWDIAKNIYTLENKKLGIIGYGSIGKEIAKKAKAFNMHVKAIRRLQKNKSSAKNIDELLPLCYLDYILSESDFIIIACPLTLHTKHLVDRKKLNLISEKSYLINISRGAIIKEDDLIQHLKDKKIKGAVLDVFNSEPLDENSELFNLDNVFLSPHISGNFNGYQKKVIESFAENLLRFIYKKPLKNRVCKKRLY
mgnify:FL=1